MFVSTHISLLNRYLTFHTRMRVFLLSWIRIRFRNSYPDQGAPNWGNKIYFIKDYIKWGHLLRKSPSDLFLICSLIMLDIGHHRKLAATLNLTKFYSRKLFFSFFQFRKACIRLSGAYWNRGQSSNRTPAWPVYVQVSTGGMDRTPSKVDGYMGRRALGAR